MPPVPAIPGARLIKALEKTGFTTARVRGSHHVLRHPDGRTVVVPIHPGRDVPPGTLRNVLRIIGMTADELRAFCDRQRHSAGLREVQVNPGISPARGAARFPGRTSRTRRGMIIGSRAVSASRPGRATRCRPCL